MANKHFIIDPAGVVHTRNSTSRTYSHAVIARRSYDSALASAEAYRCPNYEYYRSIADGTSRHLAPRSWQTADQHAARLKAAVATALADLNGAESAEAYVAAKRAEAVARVEADEAAGEFDEWSVLGWAGRPDLADKLAASSRNRGCWADVTVLEAQRK